MQNILQMKLDSNLKTHFLGSLEGIFKHFYIIYRSFIDLLVIGSLKLFFSIFDPKRKHDALYFSQNIFWVKRNLPFENKRNQSCGKWSFYDVLLLHKLDQNGVNFLTPGFENVL